MTHRLMIVTCLFLLIAVSLGCGHLIPVIRGSKPTPMILNWDLSDSHELRDIGWETKAPVDNGLQKDYFHENGDFDLTLKLSEGRVFHQHVQDVYVTKSNSTIKHLVLATFPMTLDEAQTKGRQLIDYWKFDPRDFDDWCAARRKGVHESGEMKFETNQNFVYPSLSLSVPYSFDRRKPWFILFEVTWAKTTGPVSPD